MAFPVSGVSVAEGQTGFRHPVLGVSGFPAVRGRACALNGTVLVLISANAASEPWTSRNQHWRLRSYAPARPWRVAPGR